MAETPKSGKDDAELDDWAAAIDEWDANLALPSAEDQAKKAAAEAAAAEAAAAGDSALDALPDIGDPKRHSMPTPAAGIAVKSDPTLTPLPPPPGTSLPDPLMQLFDGDMELPEEAGQALGSLLGTPQPATMVAPIGSIEKLLEADMPGEFDDGESGGLYSEGGESTRVASVDEFDKLLADTAAAVENEPSRGPSAEVEPSVPKQQSSRAGSFSGGSTRVAGEGEVESLLADDADIEKDLPEVPSSAPFKSPLLPEPGSKLPSGAFKSPSTAAKLASGRMPMPSTPSGRFTSAPVEPPRSREPQRPSAPPPDDDDLDVEMEIGNVIDQVASQPPAVDEDFYDDIEVMPAREEPSQRVAPRRPTPAPPPEPDNDPLFDLPIAIEGTSSPEIRMRDPDRTPLPVAKEDAEALGGVAPARPIAQAESKPIEAVRLEAPPPPLQTLKLPELAKPRPLETTYLRDQLGLYDTERLLTPSEDKARVARLSHAAGRIAEKLGDVAGAIERYEAALEADPHHAHALRGLRRLRLADGKREPVLQLLEREIAGAAAGEKRGLHAWRAELALALGDREVARAEYDAMLALDGQDLVALSGLCDLASAGGNDDQLAAALATLNDALASSVDAATKAALSVERGRIDEAAGRVPQAVERYRAALDADPSSSAAAWGLWRVAVRTPGPHDDLETYNRLVERLPAGDSPLRHALERRLGLLRWRAGDLAAARPPLQAASADGDRVALFDLAELERADGRLDEAAQSLLRTIDDEPDAGRRADRLVLLGELAEKRGNVAQAAEAYQRAAREFPDDPRAARALERAHATGGDKESALQKHLDAAARNRTRAPMELTFAARLLRDLGRHDEARAKLQAALAVAPALGPAVDLAVEVELAANQPERAAAILSRAADAVDEAGVSQALRMRAARILAHANKVADALSVVQPLLSSAAGTDVARPLRWLEQRILRQSPAEEPRLAESLRAEAEAAELAGDKRRAAALAYELAVLSRNNGDDAAIDHWKRALALDPSRSGAALELAARVFPDAERRAAELPALLTARMQAASLESGRPEAVALSLRLGESLLDDARDLREAERAFAGAQKLAPNYGPLREGLDRVARRSDDAAAQLVALEREAGDTESPEQRFALDVAIGERLERGAMQPEKAAERYRHALELRPHHPVAREALERAYRSARNYSALADLALADLKEAPDPQAKVRAYERLAFIDGDLRGEADSARLAYESIIEVDHAHHPAMRVLEKHYLSTADWPELVAIYEQLGLTASDPHFAVAVHLDRARLRRRLATEATAAEVETAVDNDYRLALFKDRRSRPALRHVYARARAAHDVPQIAEMAAALADAVGDDARTAAVMLTRAAEALVEAEGPPDDTMPASTSSAEARARYQAALEKVPAHVPALVGLCDLALARSDFAVAAEMAGRAGQALKDPQSRARYFTVAGALLQEKLDDKPRAVEALRHALSAEPRSHEAFSRLEHLLRELHDFAALSQLYHDRLQVETDGGRLMALHLLLARIYRDEVKDRERARGELKAVLAQNAAHPEALEALADLQFEDKQWAEAAETLIRRARAEKSRTALKDIFFKLGLIYSEHLPDPKRAVAAFTRVLQVTPDDTVALEHLSNLHLKEWEWKGALQATLRLAELERDRHKRVNHLHRVAKIYEEGFKDARHALEALRRALELDPMWMPSIGELAKFFDRQSDVQSMRVHLDRTAARVRQQLDANPYDAQAYHSLFKIFLWRRAPDRAAVAAGVLEWLGASEADEKTQLAKLTGRDNYPGSSLADPTLDETLFDARVPAGFRNLFRLLDDALGKMFRADVKRLGVQRSEKLPRSGNPVRDLANRIAGDLGIRDFDLYVTAAHPTALVVELTDPLSIVIGNKVVEGASPEELRFLLGRSFKMIQSHMALPMRLTPEDLGLLVGGIVRQFVPDFVPQGFEEAQIVAEAGRMARVIPKKMHAELLPFALECAGSSFDLKQIGPSLVHTANRAGLLTCGLPMPALNAVRRLQDEAQLRALLRFTVSDELAELRRQLGTSIG
jgi:cellulose synthase operon protein C